MKLKPATDAFVMIKTTCVPSPSGGGTGWGCNCELKKSDFLENYTQKWYNYKKYQVAETMIKA